jgi:hypothetical protein
LKKIFSSCIFLPFLFFILLTHNIVNIKTNVNIN